MDACVRELPIGHFVWDQSTSHEGAVDYHTLLSSSTWNSSAISLHGLFDQSRRCSTVEYM